MIPVIYGALKSWMWSLLGVDATVEGNIINIPFYYQGSVYRITLPYARKHAPNMSSLQVILTKNNDEEQNITHLPGIPYLVSAQQLGGNSMTVYDINTETSRSIEYDEAPMFIVSR